jgi:hypothetical protein
MNSTAAQTFPRPVEFVIEGARWELIEVRPGELGAAGATRWLIDMRERLAEALRAGRVITVDGKRVMLARVGPFDQAMIFTVRWIPYVTVDTWDRVRIGSMSFPPPREPEHCPYCKTGTMYQRTATALFDTSPRPVLVCVGGCGQTQRNEPSDLQLARAPVYGATLAARCRDDVPPPCEHGKIRCGTCREAIARGAVALLAWCCRLWDERPIDPALEAACRAVARAIEAKRGDGVPFWDGANAEQRASTRETTEYLLAGESVERWSDPAGGEAVRVIARRAHRVATEAPLVALVAAVPDGLDARGWTAAVLAHVEHLRCGSISIQWAELARDFETWLRAELQRASGSEYARDAAAAYRRAIAPPGPRPAPFVRHLPGLPCDMGDG